MCTIGEVCERNKQGEKIVTGVLIDEPQFQKLFHLDGWNDVVIVAARTFQVEHVRNPTRSAGTVSFILADYFTFSMTLSCRQRDVSS